MRALPRSGRHRPVELEAHRPLRRPEAALHSCTRPRGRTLIYLPFSGLLDRGPGIFAVFYGLDWIATVPPTLRLANQAFGSAAAPIVFGWIAAGHQLVGAPAPPSWAGRCASRRAAIWRAFLIAGAAAAGGGGHVSTVRFLGVGQRPRQASLRSALGHGFKRCHCTGRNILANINRRNK